MNSTSGSDLDHFPVICILFCISLPNFVQIGAVTAANNVISFYQDGRRSRGRWILFPVSYLLYRCLQKVKVYEQTKFRRHISIDGGDITTFVFEKNVRRIGNLLSVSISIICPKSAYYSASGHRISSKSKHILRKYDVISISQDGGRDGWILLLISYLLMSLPSESQSILANQILSRYLKWRLRYNYFRYRNTNVRHIGILLPVSISTSSP